MIDVLLSIPTIPLWMALAAAIPRDWTVLQTYFAITMVLAIVGWAGLARVVRGKLLALREEDYILAAQIAGVKESKVITTHLLPNFFSYLISYRKDVSLYLGRSVQLNLQHTPESMSSSLNCKYHDNGNANH